MDALVRDPVRPLLMTADMFRDAVRTARRGERIVYHIGNLLWDRSGWNVSNPQRKAIDAVGLAAWEALIAGKVLLFQHRVDGCSEYIAARL